MASLMNYINLQTNIPKVAAQAANGLMKASTAAMNFANKLNAVPQAATAAGNAVNGMMANFAANMLSTWTTRFIDGVMGSVSSLMNMATQYSTIQGRLKLIAGSQENAIALNDKIFESAQRARGGYMEMAEAVAQLSQSAHDAFPDPREAVDFMEGIQKLFVVGGADKEHQQFAMLQLTQGLASGQLQGDEFRSIAENAPIIENIIAKTLGVTRGELKKLSSEGKITADVIKRSIMENMDEINQQFESMPKTWGDHMTNVGNRAKQALVPVFQRWSDLANSDAVRELMDGVASAIVAVTPYLYALVGGIEWAIDMAVGAFKFMKDFITNNWGLIEVVLLGVVAVLGWYATMALISAGNTLIAAAATAVKTVEDWLATAAIVAMEIAQYGLNGAMATGVLTMGMMVAAVIAGIVIFYIIIGVINYFAGTSISATGLIFGAFAWLFAGIRNLVAHTWNLFLSFAEFIGNLFHDPLGAIYNLFADIWNGILDLAAAAFPKLIEWIKKIPGLGLMLDGVTFGTFHVDKKNIKGGVHLDGAKMGYVDQGEAANAGYDKGKYIGDTISQGLKMPDSIKHEYENKAGKDTEKKAKTGDEIGNGPKSGATKAAKDTAENTKRMADKLDMTAEELKEFRQGAIQSALNEWKTEHTVVNIDMQNTINNRGDLDGVVEDIRKGIEGAIRAKREGVMA